MIGYVKGSLAYTSAEGILVDNHGIGYRIRVPDSMLQNLPAIGEEIMVYTYTYVREDAIGLFGFETLDELEVFRLLITVSGIGPKGGLAILSTMGTDSLRYAVMTEDAKTIAKAPGIGAKTASKLILELKDKLGDKDTLLAGIPGDATSSGTGGATTAMEDAKEALVALGYSPTEARKAVASVPEGDRMDVEELLKLSLKYL